MPVRNSHQKIELQVTPFTQSPTEMFLVTYIYRQASSGAEHSYPHIFQTLEEATEYIRTEWYDDFCESNYYPEEWDEENLGGPMPSRDDFVKFIKERKWSTIFAPYDKHHAIVQNELRIQEIHEKKK
jgi:hypothetical protein